MNSEVLTRRLSAILSADVEGYSRLMGEDEGATVKTLERYREGMAGSRLRPSSSQDAAMFTKEWMRNQPMPHLAYRLFRPYSETFPAYWEHYGKVTEQYVLQRSLIDRTTGLRGTSIRPHFAVDAIALSQQVPPAGTAADFNPHGCDHSGHT
jgi:hypothetical protein